jgi:hypothetical protein
VIKVGESVCIFNDYDEKRIRAVCSEGTMCRVAGFVALCEQSGGCVKISDITSVRRHRR